ncbi:MAG: hypothetical protein EF813_08625 [Methanosarcinales archaeon]|nr:MAG: hypothetical protein EF813_08625 [Methanosarcinales archaeon]
MEQIAVYFIRALQKLISKVMLGLLDYIVLLMLSAPTVFFLIDYLDISEFISKFNSIYIIILLSIFSVSMVYYSIYVYLKFSKSNAKRWLKRGFVGIVGVIAVQRVLRWLGGYELGGKLLLESFEPIYSYLHVLGMIAVVVCTLSVMSLFAEWVGGHKINTYFTDAIKRLEKIQNNEIKNYKDMYEIHNASDEYGSGIKEVKNLLIRGIDLDRFFDLNTELSLNEILDWLTFSMQYYLFYGEIEQMKAVKIHLECMTDNFDENYCINADNFVREILRMYDEIDRYFKENNICIVRSTKFTDRAMSYLQPVLLAIVLLVISMITKYFIIN